MKTFHNFDPLNPFFITEQVQINNRKTRLSHIPLKNSVSIRGFLQESILGDVKSNSFWVDYRDYDGYRSSNGEIIFDNSHENEIVDVDYLAVGTVLRADDMNEVAERLQNLESATNSINNDVFNNSTKIKNAYDNFSQDLKTHNIADNSHLDIRDSIKSQLDQFNYRFNAISQGYEGLQKNIANTYDSLHSEIENASVNVDSIVSLATSYVDYVQSQNSDKFTEFRNEIDGFYNAIDSGDEYIESKINRLDEKFAGMLATERLSAQNQIKSLKDELYNRMNSEIKNKSSIAAESVKQELIESIKSDNPQINSISNQIELLRNEYDKLSTKYFILDNLLAEELDNRKLNDDTISEKLSDFMEYGSAFNVSINNSVANLAQTLYQARNAVNNQFDSIHADIILANNNLTYSRTIFEKKIEEIQDLDHQLREQFDFMQDDFDEQIDSVLTSVNSNFDSILTIFNQSNISLESALDEVEKMRENVNEMFQPVIDNAIDDLNDELILYINDRLASLTANIESKFENLSLSVQNSINNSDFATGSSLININASINSLSDSIKVIDKKPIVLSTTSSTVPGAIWYSN